MKLIWVLCLCFISIHSLVRAEDETSTLDTTLPSFETTSTLSSDLATDALPLTEAPAKSVDTSTTDDASKASSQPAEDSSPVTAGESTSVTVAVPEATLGNSFSDLNSSLVIIKLSHQIERILEHFQQENPVGFPGQDILPDPLPAPNVSEGFGLLGKSEFYNITVHGLSNFTVEMVNMMLDQMTVYVQIRIKNVQILGNCTQSTGYFFTSHGPFNLTLTNVTAEGIVFLVIESDGSFHANRSMTKIKYEKVAFRYGDKPSAPLSEVVNAAGQAVIGTILPFIQALIDERLTADVNKRLAGSPKFPAIRNVSAVDLAIVKGRDYVAKRYDPYTVPNVIDFDSPYFSLQVGPVTLAGLSNFARVGDISCGMARRTLVMRVRMVTGRVRGSGQFYFNFGKVPQIPARRGRANFTVDRLQFEATVHQPMDLAEKPRLDDLQLEVGPVSVKLDQLGSFDYFIELAVRRLPDYLRYYLVDLLEGPIKRRIQKDILDEVNVKEVLSSNIPLLEKVLQENRV